MSKVALVTGASSGIGNHITHQLLKTNYRVIAIDCNLNPFDDSVTFFQLDLTNEDHSNKVFNEIEKIDAAINCAGVPCERKDLIEFSAIEITHEWQKNFIATFNALKNEIMIMRKHHSGKIINLSSISAHLGMKNFSAYGASKASISAISRIAATENAAYNIQVNAISPATIDTPMIRKKYNGKKRDYSDVYHTGDCGSVSDVFSVVKMLLENDFLTGSDIKLDGGLSGLCVI